jgi:hypothetical protein
MGDLGEGQAGALLGHVSVGGRADELVAQRPQEVSLVHGADREGDRLLGGVLGRGDHREAAHPRRLESLPLEGATIPPTMSPIDGASYLSCAHTGCVSLCLANAVSIFGALASLSTLQVALRFVGLIVQSLNKQIWSYPEDSCNNK